MTQTLKELLALNMKLAAEMTVAQGSLSPMFVLIGKEISLILTPWQDDEEKHKLCDMVEAKMKAEGIKQYVHMAEAWMATIDKGTDKDVAKLKPRDREDKTEVVIVSANDRHASLVGFLEIERDPSGKIVSATPSKTTIDDGTGQFGGRMLTLLRSDTPDSVMEQFERDLQ